MNNYRYFQEVTNDWKCSYHVPQHTYIFNRDVCVGYIKEGTTEEIIWKTPSKQFSKSRRKFKEVK
jgi:hypothetical protein